MLGDRGIQAAPGRMQRRVDCGEHRVGDRDRLAREGAAQRQEGRVAGDLSGIDGALGLADGGEGR